MESSSNGKEKSIRQLPVIRKEAISSAGNLRYSILTMGKVIRLPLRGSSHKRSGKKTPSTSISYTDKFTQEKNEKLIKHVKICKRIRSNSKGTRLYLRNVAMEYIDPVVVGKAKMEHYKLATRELLEQEKLDRYFVDSELQFSLYIARRTTENKSG